MNHYIFGLSFLYWGYISMLKGINKEIKGRSYFW